MTLRMIDGLAFQDDHNASSRSLNTMVTHKMTVTDEMLKALDVFNRRFPLYTIVDWVELHPATLQAWKGPIGAAFNAFGLRAIYQPDCLVSMHRIELVPRADVLPGCVVTRLASGHFDIPAEWCEVQ